jgi:hypothetical protein
LQLVDDDFLNLRRAARLAAAAGHSFAHILYALKLRFGHDEGERKLVPLCDELMQLCKADAQVALIVQHKLKPVGNDRRARGESDDIWTAREMYESVLLLLETRAAALMRDLHDNVARKRAVELWQSLRRILMLSPDPDDVAKTRIARATANVGVACRGDEAASMFQAALDAFDKLGEVAEQVNALRLLADNAMLAGKHDKALVFVDDAIKRASALRRHPLVSACALQRREILLRSGSGESMPPLDTNDTGLRFAFGIFVKCLLLLIHCVFW